MPTSSTILSGKGGADLGDQSSADGAFTGLFLDNLVGQGSRRCDRSLDPKRSEKSPEAPTEAGVRREPSAGSKRPQGGMGQLARGSHAGQEPSDGSRNGLVHVSPDQRRDA